MTLSSSSTSDGDPSLPSIIVLDACVLLNLFATGRVEDILISLSSRCLLSSYVRREALWYLTPMDQAGEAMARRDIELEPLIAAGLVKIVDLTEEEQNVFLELAQELGDGEAASGALAIGSLAAVATDDAKACKIFARRIPPLPVIGTATLLRSWEARSTVSRADVAAALQAIQSGARYYPRDSDYNAAWWRGRIREASLH